MVESFSTGLQCGFSALICWLVVSSLLLRESFSTGSRVVSVHSKFLVFVAFFFSIVFRWSLERFQCSDFIGIDDCNQCFLFQWFRSSPSAVPVQFQCFDLSVLKRFNEFFIVGNPNCVALFNRFPLVISVRFRHGFGAVSVPMFIVYIDVLLCFYLLFIVDSSFAVLSLSFSAGPCRAVSARFHCGFIGFLDLI